MEQVVKTNPINFNENYNVARGERNPNLAVEVFQGRHRVSKFIFDEDILNCLLTRLKCSRIYTKSLLALFRLFIQGEYEICYLNYN